MHTEMWTSKEPQNTLVCAHHGDDGDSDEGFVSISQLPKELKFKLITASSLCLSARVHWRVYVSVWESKYVCMHKNFYLCV